MSINSYLMRRAEIKRLIQSIKSKNNKLKLTKTLNIYKRRRTYAKLLKDTHTQF